MVDFVGREREIAELRNHLDRALGGQRQFVVIGGEAGTGKSRLLAELEKLAVPRRFQILHASFAQETFPYQAFCDLIGEYFLSEQGQKSGAADFSDLAPDLVALFPVLEEIEAFRNLPGAGEGRKFEESTYIFELLARSLIRIGGGKPMALFLEDLHAADTSLDALQYIIRRLGPTPTLVAGTYLQTDLAKKRSLLRMLDSFLGDRGFSRIRLDPFFPSEHRSFLEAILGSADLEQNLADRLYDVTAGNPYFTVEFVRWLTGSGQIARNASGRWTLAEQREGTEDTLPGTVKRGFANLPKKFRSLLSTASILGRSFSLRNLRLLLKKRAKPEETLEEMVQAGLLTRDPLGFSFAGHVGRDVSYARLSKKKRKAFHQQFAEELEKANVENLERVYSQLLHHYSQAGISEKVVDYGLMLSIRSLAAVSPQESIRAIGTVLQSIDPHSEENQSLIAEARTLLAASYHMAGNIDGALKEFEQAIPIFEQQAVAFQVMRAALLATQAAWEGRRVEDTLRWVKKGIDAARAAEETASLVKFLSMGVTIANLRGNYDEAKEYLQEIERLQPSLATQEAVQPGGTFVVAVPLEIHVRHPISTNFIEEEEIFSNVYETLLSTDEYGNLVPAVCQKWEALEGNQSFVFTLRRDVRMHDGRMFTAKDVKTAMEDAILLEPASLPAAYSSISGVAEFIKGVAPEVLGIVVMSEFLLQIQLTEPLAIYPSLLTDTRASILKETQSGENKVSAGTGPFRLVSLQPDRVELARNPDYWTGTPALLDGIEFRCGMSPESIAAALRSGEVDLARDLGSDDLESILRDPQLRAGLLEIPKKNVYFALFHPAGPYAGNFYLRQAMCGVVRVQDLVTSTLGRFALPATNFLPPGILGHDAGRHHHPLSREKAEELMQLSGLSLPVHLKAAVHRVYQDRCLPVLQGLFKSWADIGVEVSIETPDMESFLERMNHAEGLDFMMVRWSADYDDPDNFTYGLFHSRVGRFRDYFCSQEIDGLMEDARSQADPATRERLYRKVENRMMEEAVLLPLFHDIDYRIAHLRVKRLRLKSRPPYVDYVHVGKSE